MKDLFSCEHKNVSYTPRMELLLFLDNSLLTRDTTRAQTESHTTPLLCSLHNNNYRTTSIYVMDDYTRFGLAMIQMWAGFVVMSLNRTTPTDKHTICTADEGLCSCKFCCEGAPRPANFDVTRFAKVTNECELLSATKLSVLQAFWGGVALLTSEVDVKMMQEFTSSVQSAESTGSILLLCYNWSDVSSTVFEQLLLPQVELVAYTSHVLAMTRCMTAVLRA